MAPGSTREPRAARAHNSVQWKGEGWKRQGQGKERRQQRSGGDMAGDQDGDGTSATGMQVGKSNQIKSNSD
jgi:hypothetical protein